MHKKEGTKRVLIQKYGDIQFGKMVYRSAEDVSNDKKCWWVYQYMIHHQPINWAKRSDY